jgi:predicted glutamine amidotransferase
MHTQHIGPHTWQRVDGQETQREFQLTSADDLPDTLAVETVRHSTGDGAGIAFLPRDQVIKLRDALDTWLDENPEK